MSVVFCGMGCCELNDIFVECYFFGYFVCKEVFVFGGWYGDWFFE